MAGLVIGQATGRRGVTSVALTVPSILAVAGSPITDSGTLAVTLATQTANLVFAGPSSGGAAAPTFRSLVVGDIPVLDDTRLANAVILAPAASTRNVIQPTGAAAVPLIVKGASGQSVSLQEWQDSTGSVRVLLNATGDITMLGSLNVANQAVRIGSTGITRIGGAGHFLDVSGSVLRLGSVSGGSVSLAFLTDSVTRMTIATGTGATTHAILAPVTNTVTNAIVIDHQSSSGTPAAGFGHAILFSGQSSTTAQRSMGRIRTEWTTATDASRASRMVLSTYNVATEIDALSILAITSTVLRITSAASGSQYIEFSQNGTIKGVWGYHAGSDTIQLAFGANFATNFLAIASSGKVGVGATAPSSQLDIAGDVEITSTAAYYMGDPTTDGSWRITRSGNDLVIQRRESGSWVTKSTIAA